MLASTSIDLLQQSSETLAGRAACCESFPLAKDIRAVTLPVILQLLAQSR